MPESVDDSALLAAMRALERSDKQVREARASRALWMSAHIQVPSALAWDSSETPWVFQEARDCFVNGHFLAVLLLSMAFIEHTVMDELQQRSLATKRVGFSDALKLAREHHLFLPHMLEKAGELGLIRNAVAHRKPLDCPDSLTRRIQALKQHPVSLLEADAKEALLLMFAFFTAALREVPKNFSG